MCVRVCLDLGVYLGLSGRKCTLRSHKPVSKVDLQKSDVVKSNESSRSSIAPDGTGRDGEVQRERLRGRGTDADAEAQRGTEGAESTGYNSI